MGLAFSVVIPVYNEVQSLAPLVERLVPVLKDLGSAEAIFVNDGSHDGSSEELDRLQALHPDLIKVAHLQRNCGKAIALQTGFDLSSGELVAMMDADLQDAPEELPILTAHLKSQNLDVVTGWKFERHDPLSKRLPSKLFNWVVSRTLGQTIHDFNCGIKLMRRHCLSALYLHGQLHRFILVFLITAGFKVGEMKVRHAPRTFGRSKYGTWRIFEGLMDFVAVIFITYFSQSPLYFFGFWGLCSIAFGLIFGGFFLLLHLIYLMGDFPQGDMVQHPVWILSPIAILIGVVFMFFGLLAEMGYHLARPRQDHLVSRTKGFGPPPGQDS